MSHAFIIMQIGNAELDTMATVAMVPAIEKAGLLARRVDKHNQGGLLKSEIIQFIQESEIIVADLTNERPNCYLEVGYAMGIDKFKNLIMTVREDHFPDSPNHRAGGPRIHFDLSGYDILPWHPDRLDHFRLELEKRIRRRVAIVAQASVPTAPVWDAEWIATQRSAGLGGVAKVGRDAYMEMRLALHPPKPQFDQSTLNEAAQRAPIHTFGWPIAVYLHTDRARPRPRSDGLRAEITSHADRSFDYWALRKNGDFYWLGSLFEDEREPGAIFFNTRIVRVTEALLYCARLYSNLGIDRSALVHVAIRHAGLRDRTLKASSLNRSLSRELRSLENESEIELHFALEEIETNLVAIVKSIVAPMFELFDFFVLSDTVYEDIVDKFVQGNIS